MLTRDDARRALLDHMVQGTFDFSVLSDREMLELVLHMLLDQQRQFLNKIGPPRPE